MQVQYYFEALLYNMDIMYNSTCCCYFRTDISCLLLNYLLLKLFCIAWERHTRLCFYSFGLHVKHLKELLKCFWPRIHKNVEYQLEEYPEGFNTLPSACYEQVVCVQPCCLLCVFEHWGCKHFLAQTWVKSPNQKIWLFDLSLGIIPIVFNWQLYMQPQNEGLAVGEGEEIGTVTCRKAESIFWACEAWIGGENLYCAMYLLINSSAGDTWR